MSTVKARAKADKTDRSDKSIKSANAARPARSAKLADSTKANAAPRTLDWELRLNFLIHDVSRLRRSAFDRCMKPLNVTRSQWWVLAYLSREDGMTQSQLAEELDLGKVAIGGLIDRLEKTGFVRRESDPSDRRVNRVFLEPKSKPMIARLRKVDQRLNEQILNGLLSENLELTANALAGMKRNLLIYLQTT